MFAVAPCELFQWVFKIELVYFRTVGFITVFTWGYRLYIFTMQSLKSYLNTMRNTRAYVNISINVIYIKMKTKNQSVWKFISRQCVQNI